MIAFVNKPEDALKLIKAISSGQTNPFNKWNNLGDQDIFSDNKPQNIITEFNKYIHELVQVLDQKSLSIGINI